MEEFSLEEHRRVSSLTEERLVSEMNIADCVGLDVNERTENQEKLQVPVAVG